MAGQQFEYALMTSDNRASAKESGNENANGNLTTLTKGSDGSVAARYEYSPFHKVFRATGPMAKENTHFAATKYYGYESRLYLLF